MEKVISLSQLDKVLYSALKEKIITQNQYDKIYELFGDEIKDNDFIGNIDAKKSKSKSKKQSKELEDFINNFELDLTDLDKYL